MAKYLISEDGKTITCFKCGRTSHHPHDVKERYCGYCSVFHDEKRWDDQKIHTNLTLIIEKAREINKLFKEILG